jgi:Ca2+-binding RTX toxin-like protein
MRASVAIRGGDLLLGGDGADDLHGRSGDDVLGGESGRDRCSGGSGHDLAQIDACERIKGAVPT